VPVAGSKLLPEPVTMLTGHNLEIKITDKTRPGKYTINLFCTRKAGKRQLIDSAVMKRVRILKILGGFRQPDQPGLPKQFKPGRDGLQRTAAARQEAAPRYGSLTHETAGRERLGGQDDGGGTA